MKKTLITAAAGMAFTAVFAGGLASAQEEYEDPEEGYPGNLDERCEQLPSAEQVKSPELYYIEEILKKLGDIELTSEVPYQTPGWNILDVPGLLELASVCYPADIKRIFEDRVDEATQQKD